MNQSNQATSQVASQAVEDRNPHRDLMNQLDQLVRTYGRVELVSSSDGKIDVRCAGVATYERTLYAAVTTRVSLEAARVTEKLMGGEGAALGATRQGVR